VAWPQVQLSSVARVQAGGKSGQSGLSFVESGYPAYGAGGVNGHLPDWEFEDGAVILSSIGARCGKCFFPTGRWSSLANTQLIFPDPDRVDRKFLWYLLNDEDRWHRSGTAQPYIKPADVKANVIPLPPLPEQRRIASILDNVERAKWTRRESIQLTTAVIDSLFHQKTSERSPTKPLGSLLKLSSGRFLPTKAMVADGSVAVYGGNGVSGRHDVAMFDTPQVVVGRVGAYCGVVHVTERESWVTDNAMVVTWRQEEFELDYLAAALKAANLNQFASQSGQPLISASRLERVMLRVPEKPIQLEYVEDLKSIQAIEALHVAHLAKLDDLFASLQHRAFRGEL